MALVRLVYKSVNEIVGNDDVGILLLTNEEGTRQLSMVCDRHMVYQFRLRLSKAEIVDRLLPEVLWQVVIRNLDLQFQVIINDLVDGQYKTLLFMPEILQAIPIRASDAILLAHFSNIPIFIEENLLLRQSVPYHEESQGVSVPVNVITTDMLKKALQKAVSEENYEQASQLRDELRRRNERETNT